MGITKANSILIKHKKKNPVNVHEHVAGSALFEYYYL